MAERISKRQLVEELALHNDLGTNAAASRVLEALITKITTEVTAGNTVVLSGLGQFEPYTLQSGKRVPKFRPAEQFKRAVTQ